MVEGLVSAGPYFRGDGIPPFLRICEFRVDIEDDSTKRENPVPDHFADVEFCVALFHGTTSFQAKMW
jgi:hypothetical protein